MSLQEKSVKKYNCKLLLKFFKSTLSSKVSLFYLAPSEKFK